MKLVLRKAQRKDWDDILELRNDNFSYFYKQKKPLSKAHHYEYMKKQQRNPNFHHWMISSDGLIVGYIRILDNDVGIIIKKSHQNKGIASKSLKIVEKKARSLGIKKLVALIKTGNISSEMIFKKNNYDLKMYWYEKQL